MSRIYLVEQFILGPTRGFVDVYILDTTRVGISQQAVTEKINKARRFRKLAYVHESNNEENVPCMATLHT